VQKKSIVLDLKQASGREQAIALVRDADILVEQFRAGVMQRLGLGYEALSALHPGLIYCSISGFGQDGPLAQVAAHDLNYLAEAGLLSLTAATTEPRDCRRRSSQILRVGLTLR